MNIEIVSGSPRQGSITIRVAKYLQQLLQTQTPHNVGLIDVKEWLLPALQQEVFSSYETAPTHLQPLVQRMQQAQAFILVTPEYNGSYTPAMKNLLDHFPKQSRKAFGIVTASTGIMGGIRASQQMQLLINGLFGIGSPYMLIVPQVDKKFDAHNQLVDETFQKSINTFISEYLWLAERLGN